MAPATRASRPSSRSRWPIAVGVYIAYNLIIFTSWGVAGADYRDLVSERVVFKSLIAPLALGGLFAASAVSVLGWWRAALFEENRASPKWPMWFVLSPMVGFVAINAISVKWATLSPMHLAMLLAAGLMVGFNEELVTRGVLVTGVRRSGAHEAQTWFWASALFGAMHFPNILVGLPMAGALIQAVFAFLMGGAFYVARRVSGTILLPMALHASWDFTSFSLQATEGAARLSPYFQFATYLAAITAVIALLRQSRGAR